MCTTRCTYVHTELDALAWRVLSTNLACTVPIVDYKYRPISKVFRSCLLARSLYALSRSRQNGTQIHTAQSAAHYIICTSYHRSMCAPENSRCMFLAERMHLIDSKVCFFTSTSSSVFILTLLLIESSSAKLNELRSR